MEADPFAEKPINDRQWLPPLTTSRQNERFGLLRVIRVDLAARRPFPVYPLKADMRTGARLRRYGPQAEGQRCFALIASLIGERPGGRFPNCGPLSPITLLQF